MYSSVGNKCIMCGSYAINPNIHDRGEKEDLDLCDVCYWRKRADKDFANEIEKERRELKARKKSR